MSSDPLDPPVFSAADWLARQRARGAIAPHTPPRSVVFVYQRGLLQRARRQAYQKVSGFAAEIYILKNGPGRAALAGNFGLGGPAVAALAELLAAWGVRRFVSLGLAGGLQPGLRPGDIVLCSRAARGEGVSAHYLPPGEWAAADADLTAGLSAALNQRGLVHQVGASWTTDAPWRELRSAAAARQQAGVLSVEMEAAALFAVGQALNVPSAAACVIADNLADGRWQWSGDMRRVDEQLRAVCAAVLAHLNE